MTRKILLLLVTITMGFSCRRVPISTVSIADGQVVLLKTKSSLAAFILDNQSFNPEQMDIQWRYRSDGGYTFKNGEHVITGSSKGVNKVSIREFEIGWSASGENGLGYLYLGDSPTGSPRPPDAEICITDKRSFDEINGNECHFRAIRP